MRRRELLVALGGAAAAWPLPALAQEQGKLPTVVYLGGTVGADDKWFASFVERFGELGWVENRTVAIERQWSNGSAERIAEIAAELVRRKVDVIVTYGAAVTTIKQATASIPVVFAVAVDPLGGGLVANLSHPGGNVTGLSVQSAEVASKRLQLLREIMPGLSRLAILFDATYPASTREADNARVSANQLGLAVMSRGLQKVADIAPAFDAFKDQVDAVYIAETALLNTSQTGIVGLGLAAKLPVTATSGTFAKAGALMTYGANIPALYRRASEMVDKILRGAKPGDIPVEQPTQFDLVVNLKTANALGLTVPDKVLAIANEVIE
jgi:putative tryptophan/tyrosine transport system substrate-binding protein